MNETDEPKIPLDEFAERIERAFEEIGRDQKRLAADLKKARLKLKVPNGHNPNISSPDETTNS